MEKLFCLGVALGMAAGALIGLWGELVGVLRRAVSAGFWLNLLCDLLFTLGGALMLALARMGAAC